MAFADPGLGHDRVVLPFFTEYPYGVYIIGRNHKQNLTQLCEREKQNLAAALRQTVEMLDSLFDKPFPYMMCLHQKAAELRAAYEKFMWKDLNR